MVVEPTTPAVSTSGAGPSGYRSRRASPSQSSSAMDEDAAIHRQAELIHQEHIEKQRMHAAQEAARAARAEEDRAAQRRAEEAAEAAAAAAAATHRRLEANAQALGGVQESRKLAARAALARRAEQDDLQEIGLKASGRIAEATDRPKSRAKSRARAEREVDRNQREMSEEAMEDYRQYHIEGRERRAAEFREFLRQHGAGPADPMDTSPGREARLMKAMYRDVPDAFINNAVNNGYKVNTAGILVDKNNHFVTPPWTVPDAIPERIERAPVRGDRPPPEPRVPSTRTRRAPAKFADYVMK